MEEHSKTVKNLYQKIASTDGEEQVKSVKELYRFLLNEYGNKTIDEKELAYSIAGTMQFPVTQNDFFKELVELAGELELPDGQISGDKNAKLIRMLDHLNKCVA